jgi:hypothetical protein
MAIARTMKIDADLLRLVVFQRTGMGLLLSDAHFRQCVENGFTFDFQLPG